MPGFPALHSLPEFAQTPVHWASDAIHLTEVVRCHPNILSSTTLCSFCLQSVLACAILLFTASDLTFTTRHIYSRLSSPLWPSHFILSGAISNCPLLLLSSILDTFWPEGLIFQRHIFLPYHIVHGVLTARILEWFAIPSSSGPRFVRTLCYDPPVLGGPAWHNSQFHWVTHHHEKAVVQARVNGISTHQKRLQRASSPLHHMKAQQEGLAMNQEEFFTRTQACWPWPLISDSQPPELWAINFSCL